MTEIRYEIIEKIGVLSESTKGWRKEINLISWNGAEPKYDIREWAPNHEKMGKGITLSEEELKKVSFFYRKVVAARNGEKLKKYVLPDGEETDTALASVNFEVDKYCFKPGECYDCPLHVEAYDEVGNNEEYCCIDGESSSCPVKMLTVDEDEYV